MDLLASDLMSAEIDSLGGERNLENRYLQVINHVTHRCVTGSPSNFSRVKCVLRANFGLLSNPQMPEPRSLFLPST